MDNFIEKKGSGRKNVIEMVFLGFSHITARRRFAIFCAAPMLLKLTG